MQTFKLSIVFGTPPALFSKIVCATYPLLEPLRLAHTVLLYASNLKTFAHLIYAGNPQDFAT